MELLWKWRNSVTKSSESKNQISSEWQFTEWFYTFLIIHMLILILQNQQEELYNGKLFNDSYTQVSCVQNLWLALHSRPCTEEASTRPKIPSTTQYKNGAISLFRMDLGLGHGIIIGDYWSAEHLKLLIKPEIPPPPFVIHKAECFMIFPGDVLGCFTNFHIIPRCIVT